MIIPPQVKRPRWIETASASLALVLLIYLIRTGIASMVA